MTSLTDSFAGKTALLLLTTALTTGCATTPGLYGGYPSSGGGYQGNQSSPTQPAPVQQQRQITVTGSPCGNMNISYFAMANKAFQQCDANGYPVGVELGPSPSGFVPTKVFNLQNPREASQFSSAFAKADRYDQTQNDRAIRNAQRQTNRSQNNPYDAQGRDFNRTLGTANQTLNRLNQINRSIDRLFGR